MATFSADGKRLGLGGIVRLDTDSPPAATRDDITQAIVHASEGRYPPLAHLLLRDARAAWYRNQTGRAILDAATAVELSLSPMAERAGWRQRKLPTLGGLVGRLRREGHLTPESADEISELVIRPRNEAIHGGAVPGAWDTAEACKVAHRAVWAEFPL